MNRATTDRIAPGRSRIALSALAAWVLLAFSARPAGAFITRIYPLAEVLSESTHISVGRIGRIDAKRQTVTAEMAKPVKGKLEFKTIRMNLAPAAAGHARYLLTRLKARGDALVFYKREGNSLACLVHAGDTWFQLFAADNPKARDKVWWKMSHVEVYMARTYDGPTGKLIRLVRDVLAGRVDPPRPNPKAAKIDVKRLPLPVARVGAGVKGKPFSRRVRMGLTGGGEIRGIAWADVNGDEAPDALLCRQGGNVLLAGGGGTLKDVTAAMRLSGASRAAAWADYDGDGHLDLLTNDFRLLRQVGGKFRNESKRLLAPKRRNPEGAGWIDYNGDGRPDILITNGEYGIRLLANTGKGPAWFRDVSDAAGLGRRGLGVGNGDFVVFFDADGDGYTDVLYNLNDGVLARNTGKGTFRADTRCGIRLPGGSRAKRGVAAADYDNDGDVDLFIPAPGAAALYRNNNDGTFTNVIAAAGDLAKAKTPSFAGAFADANGDGALDLLVCRTDRPCRMYLGDGRGRFTDATAAVGLDDLGSAWSASWADADGDGDPDLLVHQASAVILAYNDLPRPAGRGPLTVAVHARRGLVGAVVRAFDAKGKPLGLRSLAAAEGCGGQSGPVAHFGAAVGPARVTVCLSDGRVGRRKIVVSAKGTRIDLMEKDFK